MIGKEVRKNYVVLQPFKREGKFLTSLFRNFVIAKG